MQQKHLSNILKHHPLGADAFAIAQLFQQQQQPTLVIANDAYTVQRLFNELRIFLPNYRIAILADNEILPYEKITPQKSITAKRLTTLWQILHNQLDIVIVQANTLQTKLCPMDYLQAKVFLLKVGMQLDLTSLRQNLVNCDYTLVEQVCEPGEFAIRGSIVDILPMGNSKKLIRIDLFDDIIDSLQLIDINNKQQTTTVASYELLPTHEYPVDAISLQQFAARFAQTFPLAKLNARQYADFAKELAHGLIPAGSDFYLPLFFNTTNTLFDYLKPNWHIVYFSDMLSQLTYNWQEITRHYNISQQDYPCLMPVQLFIPTDNILATIKQFVNSMFKQADVAAATINLLPDIAINTNNKITINKLHEFVQHHLKQHIVIVLDSAGSIEILKQTLLDANFNIEIITNITQISDSTTQSIVYLLHGMLSRGFMCKEWVFISEEELYPTKNNPIDYSTFNVQKNKIAATTTNEENDLIVRDLAEIAIGDYVVHVNHGIGRYIGLSTQHIEDMQYDMLSIEYQDEAKLFVPIHNLHMISRYASIDNNTVSLNKLGSNAWQKIKAKTEKQVSDMAAQLLDLYAQRSLIKRSPFTIPQEYSSFAASFIHEATYDQEVCFTAVINDMSSSKPMDRLICGDVGFGKTEVAIRAAFICAMNGKQVALLVPTTLLSEQHYQNFINRYAGLPIKIAEISRFKTKKEINQTLELVQNGQIDILIGTHRLIQQDVKFANLGLVIIDEEHRFGVKQKERLKQLRAEVDCLTMAATPIPRTLSMAIDGIRDLSIIATPPKHRLAVHTIICYDDMPMIREAILREIRRGGQVFFLFNDVANINKMYQELATLIPEAQIAVAHGQMPEQILEQTIRNFIKQHYHILLCSIIIETGLDIANANTIIIHRADKLGLAQLYQLRGRVGRSHHQAYCYLMVPENINDDVQKRLDAILATSALGSGLNLAIHDLEIRGAGEILGDIQSGNIKQVGLSLYAEMLEREVSRLKHQQIANKASVLYTTEVNLHSTTIIPESYCNDVHERLVYYKRLAKANTMQAIDAVYCEIINAYGSTPPLELKNLIASHYLRIKAHTLGITKVDVAAKQITLSFSETPNVTPDHLICVMQKLKSCNYKNNKLSFQFTATTQENLNSRIKHANILLDELL